MDERFQDWNRDRDIQFVPVPRHYLAFNAWHERNRNRLAVPIRPFKRRSGWMEIGFGNADSAILRASFNARSFNVIVNGPDGRFWDMLLSLDVDAVRLASGRWLCGICRKQKPAHEVEVFPNPEALWANHLFEPFLTFVNEELCRASALALYGGDGWSSASLVTAGIPENEEQPVHFIPLQDLHPLPRSCCR